MHDRPYSPRSQKRSFAAARLLRLWVRIPPETWMSLCCECCVLSGRGLCEELIIHPEESYRLWCVVVCDLENLVNEEALAHWGAVAPKTNKQTAYVSVTVCCEREKKPNEPSTLF